MATDDSCRDLYSQHMSTVMTLTSKSKIKKKIIFIFFKFFSNHEDRQMDNQSCVFSNEFQSYEWVSINQTIRMMITDNNIEFIGINKRFHCEKIINSEKSISIYRIRTFTNWYLIISEKRQLKTFVLFLF
jgi:hypothetical protein